MLVRVTEQILAKGQSANGAWSMDQLSLLGVDWPPSKNWKEKVIGNQISDHEVALFIGLKDKHLAKPADRERSECRLCGAPVFWARTEATGNLMPLDWLASERGNIVINDDGRAVVIKGDLFDDKAILGDRYKSHFATCPNASKHRRKK